jgi:hypothetical protein
MLKISGPKKFYYKVTNIIFVGPIYYKPNRASINKRNAKKIIIRKYEKGQKRFRIKKNVTINEETAEWEDINENKLDDQKFNTAKGSYRNAQKKLIDNWKNILSKLFNIMVENNAMERNVKCIKCKKPSTFRCMDCGPNVYFCSYCEYLFHNDINIFHQRVSLEQKSNGNQMVKLPQICSENCEHQVFRILVVHLKGK